MILKPLIEKKKTALLRYTLSELNQARNDVQKTARQCANIYWLQLCENIKIASDNGNARGMYEGIKKDIGPTVKKCAPLKSLDRQIINDRRKRMDRLVEHYLELYSRETKLTDTLNAKKAMPTLDTFPTMAKVNCAIDDLASGKAPDRDGIAVEVIRRLSSAKIGLASHLRHHHGI
jgi:hypothetical protein